MSNSRHLVIIDSLQRNIRLLLDRTDTKCYMLYTSRPEAIRDFAMRKPSSDDINPTQSTSSPTSYPSSFPKTIIIVPADLMNANMR